MPKIPPAAKKPFGLTEFYGPIMIESESSVHWNEDELDS